jgi:hypothetical protein
MMKYSVLNTTRPVYEVVPLFLQKSENRVSPTYTLGNVLTLQFWFDLFWKCAQSCQAKYCVKMWMIWGFVVNYCLSHFNILLRMAYCSYSSVKPINSTVE